MNEKNDFLNGEDSNGPYWIYEAECLSTQEDMISKVNDIVTIIEQPSSDSWPPVDRWRLILPKWFVDSFVNITREEAEVLLANTPKSDWNKLPWDFESWIDVIQYKGWKWKGFDHRNNKTFFKLEIIEWPASLEAFEKIVTESGGIIIKGDWI